MSLRTVSGIIIAALLGLFPAGAVFYLAKGEWRAGEVQLYQCRMLTMGTVATFSLYAASEVEFQRAVEAGRGEFTAVMKIANLYDKESELSRLNATAYEADFSCSAEMWQLLMRAEKAHRECAKFDITVKPLMEVWGFYRKQKHLPPPEEIARAKQRVGFEKLKFDRNRKTVRFTVPRMALDLGGIAKGYAADQAAKAVVKSGITRGVIDLGGNLKLLPQLPPGKKFYRIGMKDQAQPGRLLKKILELPGDRAVATSGDYERFVILDGVKCGHIIDPESGKPEAKTAVTVATVSALDADIFSTSAYLGGKVCAEKLSALYPDTGFYFAGTDDN